MPDDFNDDDYEMESFPLPEMCRLYRVKYLIYGRNRKPLMEMVTCLLAKDVTEIVDSLNSKLLGVEINGNDQDGEHYHETVDALDIVTIEFLYPVHGMTDDAYKLIKNKFDSSEHFRTTSDDARLDDEDREDEAEEDEK